MASASAASCFGGVLHPICTLQVVKTIRNLRLISTERLIEIIIQKLDLPPGIQRFHCSLQRNRGHVLLRVAKGFTLRQNTTIGIKTLGKRDDEYKIIIGDNVALGANSCIIGDNLSIGSNVVIGAMSFISKDIPDNCTYYTKKENVIERYEV